MPSIKFSMPTRRSYNISLIILIYLVNQIYSDGVNIYGNDHDYSKYEYKLITQERQTPSISQGRGNNSAMLEEQKKNLTAITWAHAVNSQKQLDEALKSTINMIEADISLGKKNNVGPIVPIMAHPPDNVSDITLEEFLTQIREYNNAKNDTTKKGVKLDFKTIEAFEGSLDILNSTVPKMNYPIWFNADIIEGPVNAPYKPVDAQRFFAGSVHFDNVVLSIGWTTTWGNRTEGGYTAEHIENMQKAIKHNELIEKKAYPITFPVRAGIGANSQEQLHKLVRSINSTNDVTITIWHAGQDYVDIEKLRQLIFSFGFERVYLDVSEELSSKLNLGYNSAKVTLPSFTRVLGIGALVLLISIWLHNSL